MAVDMHKVCAVEITPAANLSLAGFLLGEDHGALVFDGLRES